MNENPNRHYYALIMAGGGGTRLWPASRPDRPKQLMALGPSRKTLLTQTAERARAFTGPDRVYVITAAHQAEAVGKDLPWLKPEQILVEPVGRNTAPCIGLGAMELKVTDPEAVMAVLPADHHIADLEGFTSAARIAMGQAETGEVVTIGIKPEYPSTGYGYIETGEPTEPGGSVHWARRFVEKPDRPTAEEYLKSGRHLWNSGMFFMKADRILKDIGSFLPDLSKTLSRLEDALRKGKAGYQKALNALYPDIDPISIDYGVMEKVKKLMVVPGSFGWNDVGSWASVSTLYPTDEHKNVAVGDHIFIDTKGCLAYGDDDRTVAIVGLEDVVVVTSGNAVLVCPKDQTQQVRAVVQALKQMRNGGKS